MTPYSDAMSFNDRPSPQADLPRPSTNPLSQEHPMRPRHAAPSRHRLPVPLAHALRTAAITAALFLAALIATAAWTLYGPAYASASPLADPAAGAVPSGTPAPSAQAAQAEPTSPDRPTPCPAGEATGGTCGTDGALTGARPSPSEGSPAPFATPSTSPQRRCKGCRLTQEEYDARQADKRAAHDRALARKARGDARRAERASRSHRSKRSKAPSSASNSPTPTTPLPAPSQAADGAPDASEGYSGPEGSTTTEDTATPATGPTDLPDPRAQTPDGPSPADTARARRRSQADDIERLASARRDARSSTSPSAAPASTPSAHPSDPSPVQTAIGGLAVILIASYVVYRRHQRA